jgi:hypothetical protein
MRRAPSVSILVAAGVSSHRVRRPTFSELSQPALAVRISACLVAFSATPIRSNTASNALVQALPSPGRTHSPSTVNSMPRAEPAPASWRRDSAGWDWA